jgi:hypothetical protein
VRVMTSRYTVLPWILISEDYEMFDPWIPSSNCSTGMQGSADKCRP